MRMLDTALRSVIATLLLTGFFACTRADIEEPVSQAPKKEQPAPADETEEPSPEDESVIPSSGTEQEEGYISPDQFPMVRVELTAAPDAETAAAPAGASGCRDAASGSDGIPGARPLWSNLSCEEEPLDGEDAPFLALPDDMDGNLKTALDDKNKIQWVAGDQFKLYYASGAPNFTPATVKHGGSAASTIEGWVNENDDYYYAFYPTGFTSSINYASYGTFTITVPAEQNGQFSSCHMAVGKAAKEGVNARQFAFSNVGSYLKIVVDNTDAVSMTLTSLVSTDKIVGTFTVPFEDDAGTIDAENIEVISSSSSVTVNLPVPRAAGTTFYVALLPGAEFTKGFLLKYNYSDGLTRPAYVYEGGRTVNRRSVINVKSLDSRIVTNWFVNADDGTEDDPTAKGAGATWEKALSVTGLEALIGLNADSALAIGQSARLDGAHIHFAEGTYTPSATITLGNAAYTGLQNTKFWGGYPTTKTGADTTGRSTTGRTPVISGNDARRIFDVTGRIDASVLNFAFTNA